jgi:hypothetical protein
MRPLAPSVVVPSTIGCLLRLYEIFVLEKAPMEELARFANFWSLLPYVLAVGLSLQPGLLVAATGFAIACLVADLYAHLSLYYGPGTDSLFVIFLPLWNLLFIGPAGALAAWWFVRWRSSRKE